MPNAAPAHRARLAKAMEDRAEELGLRWQDVSAAGAVSVRALQLARDPEREGDPSRRTLEGIDRGLQWEPGSARQLLHAGRDPVPIGGARQAPDGDGHLPAAGGFARQMGVDPGDPADPFLYSVRKDIADAVIAHGAGATGAQVFHDRPGSDIEAGIWDDPALSQDSKELAIASMRADRARYEAGRPGNSSSGTAGLALAAVRGP